MSDYNIYTEFKKEFVKDFQKFDNMEGYDKETKVLLLSYINSRYLKEQNELLVKILDKLEDMGQ